MRICIGTITRNRRNGLKQLVDSYCRMKLPANCEVIFAVVENDSSPSVADILDPLKKIGEVIYEIEPQLGIPFARNHVLDISLNEKCDFTTFVDDDETVAKDWLIELLGSMQTRDLDLIGGRVKLHECPAESSSLNKCIWRGLDHQLNKASRSSDRSFEDGKEQVVVIYTNNWMVRNTFLERTNIRFDESLGFSGLSDAIFYESARLVKARTGWASNAVVYETQPLSRLTPKYQYQRGRDQSMAVFNMRFKKLTLDLFLRTAKFAIKMFFSSILLFIAAPFTRFNTLSLAFRNFGVAVGRLKALLGYKSTHYENVHSV